MVQREYITREVKVEQIHRIVEECSKESVPALKDKLIAYAGKYWGTERRKAIEYLNQLIAEESIFIDGEYVWTLKRWLKIEKSREKDYNKMRDIINGQTEL